MQVSKIKAFILLSLCFAIPAVSASVNGTAGQATSSDTRTDQAATKLASNHYIPVSERAPPGFEYLNEPTQTMVDVFYSGTYLGSVSATYTNTTITFANPEDFLKKIPQLKNSLQVLHALSGKISNHASSICPGLPGPDCGSLRPEVASVIFDASKFRVDLFISPNYLAAGVAPSPFLPAPNAGFSAVSHLYGSTTGLRDQAQTPNTNSYGLRAVNDLGYEETMLHSAFSFSENNEPNTTPTNISRYHVDELSLGQYFDSRYLLSSGILSSQGNIFVGNEDYAGVSFGTTLDTFQQDSSSFGTRLPIFLSTPSYISIYRDGRLLASAFYPAGNQILDTSTLPSGSYQIVINIRDAQGQVTQETRFFSKTSQIPPMEFPQYYFSMGYAEENQLDQTKVFPQFSNTPLYQLGYNKRIEPNWGVNTSLIGTNKVGFASGGLFFLGNGFQINPQVLYGTDKENGVGLNLMGSIDNFSASLFGRQIWAHNASPITENINTLDPNEAPVVNFLTADQNSQQADLTLGYTFERIYTAFNATVTKFADLPSTYSYGPQVRFPIFHDGGTSIDMQVSATRTQSDWQALAQFIVYFTSSNWTNATSAGYQVIRDRSGSNPDIEDRTGFVGTTSTYWQQLNAAQEGTILGVNASGEPGRESFGASGDYTAPLGGLDATIQRNTGSSTPANTQYSGSFDTHLAYAGKEATIGGARAADNTGVIVDIQSPNAGDEFQVLVDDQVVQIVKTDHPTAVFLTGFKTYRIRIKAVSARLYEYSETPRTITLYRGNFKTLVWKTRQKVVLFGYLQTLGGEPLRDTLINGGVGVNASDEDGSVQIELYNDTKVLTAHLPNGHPCVIAVPPLNKDNTLTLAKQLICQAQTLEETHDNKTIH